MPAGGCTPARTFYFVGKKVESTVNVLEQSKKAVSLNFYPNPCNDILYTGLASFNRQPIYYKIYDITGATVKQGILANDGSFNLKDINLGVYFIMLKDGTNNYKGVFVKK